MPHATEAILSCSGKIWNESPEIVFLESLMEQLLANKRLHAPDTIRAFLQPSLTDLPDPYELCDMDKAIERIIHAIENKERIMIYGDFDTDGITATVILMHGIKQCSGEVSYRIPDRSIHSHGLHVDLIEDIVSTGTKLLITCDCGISDRKEVDLLAAKGIDVIITDHHTPHKEKIPTAALAIINPKQERCTYPYPELSGSAIAFKIMSALGEKQCEDVAELEAFLDPLLEITALGIVADCVPLVGENRIIARFGIEKLRTTRWPGLQKLFNLTNITPESINEETISFTIAPRLNAASRLAEVKPAVQLFVGDPSLHDARIAKLERLNSERKLLTHQALQEAEKLLIPDAPVQILYQENWKAGILGLVAGKLCEQLNVPIIALNRKDENILHASCRSPIEGSIITALQAHAGLFEHFGGHDGAAGFQINADKLPLLRETLAAYYKTNPTPLPHQNIDAWVDPKLLNHGTLEFLKYLAPFGEGNAVPVFGVKNIAVVEYNLMGQHNNHMRLHGLTDDEIPLTFTAFFCEKLLPQVELGTTYDILCTLKENHYNGSINPALYLVDMKKSL